MIPCWAIAKQLDTISVVLQIIAAVLGVGVAWGVGVAAYLLWKEG